MAEQKRWSTRRVDFYWDIDDAAAFSRDLKIKFPNIAFIPSEADVCYLREGDSCRYVPAPGVTYYDDLATFEDIPFANEYHNHMLKLPRRFYIFCKEPGWEPEWDMRLNPHAGDPVYGNMCINDEPKWIGYLVADGDDRTSTDVQPSSFELSRRWDDKEHLSFFHKVVRLARRQMAHTELYWPSWDGKSPGWTLWVGRRLLERMRANPAVRLQGDLRPPFSSNTEENGKEPASN
jgi:hypothetical protein